VRIPKRVNTAWDWAEKNAGLLGCVVMLVVAVGTALVLPTLAALAIGVFLGAVVVHRRMRARERRLRAQIDDLLRENGALRHERTMLASGVIEAQERDTVALMIIPEEPEPEPEGDTKRLPILPDQLEPDEERRAG
jgi:hypothetical protein